MIITGAAGFLGRRLLCAFQTDYELFAVDRRPPGATGAPEGVGIHWYQADIAAPAALRDAFNAIRGQQPIRILLHLAGYYDFTGEPHPEYTRSNVEGMRNVLDMAPMFELTRLVFSSSVAACAFPPPGETVNEDTPPHGVEPYSRSKRAGEELLHAYRDRVPSNIVRLAAVFTDWCEYEPLTNFLDTWFSHRWDNRALGGRGDWAIPYIHIDDLAAFFQRVVASVDALAPLEVAQGSPNGCTTHRQLYDAATQAFYGHARPPMMIPKPVARLGIRMREGLGRVTGKMPFERAWMGAYIDEQLTVDATRTHQKLGWSPRSELDILARVPVMVQHWKTEPQEWARRQWIRKSTQYD